MAKTTLGFGARALDAMVDLRSKARKRAG